MKNIRRNSGKFILKAALALTMIIGMIPMNTANLFAEENETQQSLISVTVNINVNGQMVASDVVDENEIFEIIYGSLPVGYLYGDAYGTLESASFHVNGVKGYCFCFDPENISFFPADWSELSAANSNVVTLNYRQEVAQEEVVIEYGKVTLNIMSQKGMPLEGIEASVTGKKGADVKTLSFSSNANGIAERNDLDTSYSWTLHVNGLNYNVDFDSNNSFYTDISVRVEEEVKEEEPTEPAAPAEETPADPTVPAEEEKQQEVAPEEIKEHKLTVKYTFSTRGGISVDGMSSNAHASFDGKEATIKEGESFYLGGEFLANDNFTFNEDGTVLFGNDTYSLGTIYVKGNGAITQPGTINNDIIMGTSDIEIIINYSFDQPYYTVLTHFVDENGEEIFMTNHRDFEGSSDLMGEKTYDVSDIEGYAISGYNYLRAEGDALSGNADSAKDIYLVYAKVEEEVKEEPKEEIKEEPKEEIKEEPKEEVKEEPKEVTPEAPKEEVKETAPAAPVENNDDDQNRPTPEVAEAEEIEEAEIPEVKAEEEVVQEEEIPMVEFVEEETPLAQGQSAWALINLISVAGTLLTSLIAMIGLFRKNKDEEDMEEGKEYVERNNYKVLTVFSSIASCIVFLLTEDLRNPMVLIDRWTLLMVAIFLINLILAMVTKNRKIEKEEEELDQVSA